MMKMTQDKDQTATTERTIAGDTMIITIDGAPIAEFTRMYVGRWSVWVKKTTRQSVSAA